MEVYYHKTSGGAEYLSTTCVECANGHKEGTCEGVFARVDGDELEICHFPNIRKFPFKAIVINGLRIQFEE